MTILLFFISNYTAYANPSDAENHPPLDLLGPISAPESIRVCDKQGSLVSFGGGDREKGTKKAQKLREGGEGSNYGHRIWSVRRSPPSFLCESWGIQSVVVNFLEGVASFLVTI